MKCWILSTPRTGGNFLSLLLNETGLFPLFPGYRASFDEWLGVHYRNDSERFLASPPPFLNIHYDQFRQAFGRCDREFVRGVAGADKYILLRRRDFIGQVVSFYVARQTSAWRLYRHETMSERRVVWRADSSDKKYMSKKVTIDDSLLLVCYHWCKRFRGMWKDFENDPDAVHVWLEDLQVDTEGTLVRVLDGLGLSHPDPRGVVDRANALMVRADRPERKDVRDRLTELLVGIMV